MVILKEVAVLQTYLKNTEDAHRSIGFIPTMGALHDGHISLVKMALDDGKFAVCSVFLNPTQFNNPEDFKKYPSTVEHDIQMLAAAGCDVLFLPNVDEIYPDGASNMPVFDFGYLETVLEGEKRPGHFKGVGQVVARLLDIVKPSSLYLGQKDFQQCMVITSLKHILHLNDLKIVIAPTFREADGLAMSSRNVRLTEPQRNVAGTIYQCLISIQAKKALSSFAAVGRECKEILEEKGFVVEYVALANAATLGILDEYDNSQPMVALIAAFLGPVRLIDNLLL